MLFMRPETIEAPAAMDSIIADVTMGGLSLHQFAEMVRRSHYNWQSRGVNRLPTYC